MYSSSASYPSPFQRANTVDLSLFVKTKIIILDDQTPHGSSRPVVRLMVSYPMDKNHPVHGWMSHEEEERTRTSHVRMGIREHNCSYEHANDMFLAVLERASHRPSEAAALRGGSAGVADFWQHVGLWATLLRKASTGGVADRPVFIERHTDR